MVLYNAELECMVQKKDGDPEPVISSSLTGSHGSKFFGSLSGLIYSTCEPASSAFTQRLARFNPIFVLPVSDVPSIFETRAPTTPASTPGRRTGTGSAAISSPAPRQSRPRVPILGFRKVSLLQMISATGYPPDSQASAYSSIEEIRKGADRPVVVFPECTTSNGRGMLRFADVFGEKSKVPVRGYNVFLMCVR